MSQASASCGLEAARGFEADALTGKLAIIAQRPHHGQAHWQGGVDVFLARRGLDEIGACLHRHHRGAINIGQRIEIAGGKDCLHMRIPADFAHGSNFIVEGRPVLCQHMLARNHDVDFMRALFDGIGDFSKTERQRRQPGGKPVATEATGMPEPSSAFTAWGTMVG